MTDLVIGGILLNNLKGIPIIKIAITIGMVKKIYIVFFINDSIIALFFKKCGERGIRTLDTLTSITP